jgi:hypothetical protein
VAWEVSEVCDLNPSNWPPIKRLEVGLDIGFALLYLALAFEPFGVSSRGLGFGVVVAFDAAGYLLHAFFGPARPAKAPAKRRSR